MASKVKLCVKCGKNPATVPDRNDGPAGRKKLCSDCHSGRLAGDLRRIAELNRLHDEVQQMRAADTEPWEEYTGPGT